MFNIGPAELLVILALALIFLGPKRLPEVAKQIGRALGEVRRTTDDLRRTLDDEIREEDRARRLAEYRDRHQKAVEGGAATTASATRTTAGTPVPPAPGAIAPAGPVQVDGRDAALGAPLGGEVAARPESGAPVPELPKRAPAEPT